MFKEISQVKNRILLSALVCGLTFTSASFSAEEVQIYVQAPYIEGKVASLDDARIMGQLQKVSGNGNNVALEKALPEMIAGWGIGSDAKNLQGNILVSWKNGQSLIHVLEGAKNGNNKVSYQIHYNTKKVDIFDGSSSVSGKSNVYTVPFMIKRGSVRGNAERLAAHFGWSVHKWQATDYSIDYEHNVSFQTLEEGLNFLLSPYSISGGLISSTKSVTFQDIDK
jgi:hypothetical protein